MKYECVQVSEFPYILFNFLMNCTTVTSILKQVLGVASGMSVMSARSMSVREHCNKTMLFEGK